MKQSTLFVISFLMLTSVVAQDDSDEMYMNAYIVVADTSQHYSEVRNTMYNLKDKLGIAIDTLYRGYNSKKNIICIPEDFGNDVVAGQYVPRRYPSKSLSLEHLNFYIEKKKTISETFALVVEITDDKEVANKALLEVKKILNAAFIINTKIYMGCMH